MKVFELLQLLAELDPDAEVVLANPSAPDQPAVYRLGANGVRAIELGREGYTGLWLVEPVHAYRPWRRHSASLLEGPFSGVVLGELDA